MEIIAAKTLVSLEDLKPGSLFKYKNTIALKSDYQTERGEPEAYIIGTGEMFWGETEKINDVLVQPLLLID